METIKIRNLNKAFYGNDVLIDINLTIESGQVCSILGENGAGKSTLMKILAGVYNADSGDMELNGHKFDVINVQQASAAGIRMIFQDTQLVDALTVQENIYLGNELNFKNSFIIDEITQEKKVKEALDILKYDFHYYDIVKDLTFAQKKMLEIVKALILHSKVLILDEVSAPFTQQETKKLFDVIRRLKSMDIAIIFISHKIDEVVEISDKIVVLKDGRISTEYINTTDALEIDLFKKMAGDDYINRYPKTRAKKGCINLAVSNICNEQGTVKNVSIKIRKGEIIGVAGMLGSGKSSLLRLLAGIDTITSGTLIIDEKIVKLKSPYQAIEKGIIYLGGYKTDNLFDLMDVYFNVSISKIGKAIKNCIISEKALIDEIDWYLQKLNIKILDPYKPIMYLSFGTLQKISFLKCLYSDAKILIMDDPTISVDTVSRVELYNMMNKITHEGKSIILASSDLRELIGMCDRIYIMFEGKIVVEFSSNEMSSQRILQYASGTDNGIIKF